MDVVDVHCGPSAIVGRHEWDYARNFFTDWYHIDLVVLDDRTEFYFDSSSWCCTLGKQANHLWSLQLR